MSEKKFLSLRTKLLLFIFFLVFLLQIFSTFNQYNQIKLILLGGMVDKASTASIEFISGLDKRLSSLNTYDSKVGFVNVYAILEGDIILAGQLTKINELDQIYFLDTAGKIILQKSRAPISDGSQMDYVSSSVKNLIAKKEISTLQDQGNFIISMPVKIENNVTNFLVFYYTDKILVAQQNKLLLTNLLSLIIFLTLGALAAFYISNLITKPIISLKESAEKMASGKLNVHTRVYGHDEVGQLVVTFNKMADELFELKNSLEKKVKERTYELSLSKKDLEKKTIEANNAKLATLNILEDVEESKNKLDEAFKQLRGVDKLKNEFLSFTSHELKTPLTPILIQAQMLEEGDFGKLNGEQKKSVDMIVKNMRELNQLIGDVLDISIIQTANLKIYPEKTEITPVIKQVVEKMESSAKDKNIKINLDLSVEHPFVFDTRRIGQVILNLLSNAIKFTPENGNILIKTEEFADYVQVSVSDNGVGISQEDKDKLFRAFSQVVASYKLKQKGTGLGLAICRGIINSHKGKIGVESKLGKGSIFYFTLPKKLHLDNN